MSYDTEYILYYEPQPYAVHPIEHDKRILMDKCNVWIDGIQAIDQNNYFITPYKYGINKETRDKLHADQVLEKVEWCLWKII